MASAQDAASAPAWFENCAATTPRTEAERLALPRTSPELLKLVAICGTTVQRLISEGQFGFVFLPAMMAKDVALELEAHVNELSEERRKAAARAIRNCVLAAWELDRYGDFGNKEKLTQAFDRFAGAIAEITAAYVAQPDQR